MGLKEMKKRNDVARKLKHNSSIHRNCIRINSGDTEKHENKKFEIAWNLANEGKEFVTEAEFKDRDIRADVLSLDDKKIYEIETDPTDFELRKSDYPDDFEIEMITV